LHNLHLCNLWNPSHLWNLWNLLRYSAVVIWFFDKDGERLRYEIVRDPRSGRYRVIITRPDGTESIEEVDEPTALVERSIKLMDELRGDGWRVA